MLGREVGGTLRSGAPGAPPTAPSGAGALRGAPWWGQRVRHGKSTWGRA